MAIIAIRSLVPDSGVTIEPIRTIQPISCPVFLGVLVLSNIELTTKAPIAPKIEKVTKTVAGIALPTFETVKSTPKAVAPAQIANTAAMPYRVASAKGLSSCFIYSPFFLGGG